MNHSAKSPREFQTDPNIKAAIIYSLDHLFAYIVEIRKGNHSEYLKEADEIIKYGNLEDARRAAIHEKVKVAYLALSNTYEEVDATTCHANHLHFDYSEINLAR